MIGLGLIAPLITFFADKESESLGPVVEFPKIFTGVQTNSIQIIAVMLLLVFIFKIAFLILFQWIVIKFSMQVQKIFGSGL